METKIITFSDGLRLAHLPSTTTRAVGIAILVAAGSANEKAENNGISHFIEHNMYKGTKTRTAFEIVQEFESLGAMINAYTSKQNTCYYAVSTDDKAEKCAEILSDMMFNSTFKKEELDKERKVILEEISMSEDDNEGVAQDLAIAALYGDDTPLGRTIIGTRENVSKFEKADILKYIALNYAAEDIVISIAGSMSLEDAEEIVKKYFVGRFSSGLGRHWQDKPQETYSKYVSKFKDIEQANIYIAMPGLPLSLETKYAINVAYEIFGGGMSSRLFQEVREKAGLAYSVYAYQSGYINNGTSQIYIGTNKDSVQKSLELTKNIILEVKKNGFTQKEVDKGINTILSRYVFANESTMSKMRMIGQYALAYNTSFDLDKEVEIIKSLSLDKINETFDKCFDLNRASIAYVGREVEGNLLDIIK